MNKDQRLGVAQAVTPREHSDEAIETAGTDAIRKQAIVVVHGQGQQRPMGTVREFVMSLWQFNPQLTTKPPAADKGRDYWIVPDGKSGLFELQRVTTPPYDDRRTDFFELYYADLFENTPLRNLWRWLQRLLFVNPTDIPDRMKRVWRLLWVLTLGAGGVLVWVIFSTPTLLHIFWTEAFISTQADGRWAVNWPGWIALSVGVVGVGIEHLPRLGKPFGALGAIHQGFARVLVGISLLVLVAMMNAWAVFGALTLAALGYYGVTLVLPLFGDAASYLSAQSETVQSRQNVRTRGLTLLRALHDDPDYDRMVIIAHSLGTVVAYDLMQLLWEAVGPTKDNPPDTASLAALKNVDAFVATRAGAKSWSTKHVEAYQALQWEAFNALRRQPGKARTDTTPPRPRGWKVSDFITLGSPLGNATFLVADGAREFAKLKEERLMPTSPPQPYDPSASPTSFLDPTGMHTHHAAAFGVVRWTNIWDPVDPGSISKGDFISSPLVGDDLFGPGIDEHVVRILKGKSRGFTHNDYWRELSGQWSPASDHLTKLRDAVGMTRK